MSWLVRLADFLVKLLLKGADCCYDFTGLEIASLYTELAFFDDFDF